MKKMFFTTTQSFLLVFFIKYKRKAKCGFYAELVGLIRGALN